LGSRQDESQRDADHTRADQGRGRSRSDLVVAGITGGTIAERLSKTAGAHFQACAVRM
jgi:hypothetical protein